MSQNWQSFDSKTIQKCLDCSTRFIERENDGYASQLQHILERIAKSVPENWGTDRTDTRWMIAQTFFQYIDNIFYPYLIQRGAQLHVILFVKGYKSVEYFGLSTKY